MYKGFYKLKHEPFCLTPDPSYVYLTDQHKEALAGLVYSVMSRPGLTLLIGEAGTGKTTLLYTLRALLEKRKFSVALCVNPTLDADEFYDFLIAKIVGKPVSGQKSQQLMALEETLLRNHARQEPTVLIVDEAHRVPIELMEEIRLLLNLETPREKLLEIILAGQPELSDVFRRQDLRQLKQRVSYVCKLKPLSLDELRGYVRFRLGRAGRTDASLFPDGTLQAIYQHTGGIPRLVNTLCDNCLQIGFGMQSSQITVPIVEEAADDLDLRPLEPANGTVAPPHNTSNPFVKSAAPARSNGASQKNGEALSSSQVAAEAMKTKKGWTSWFA